MEEERKEGEAPEEKPEVYTVKKDLNGWQFDRRTFLAAAGAVAATAALGSVEGCAVPVVTQVVTQAVITQVVTAEATEALPATEAAEATDTPAPTDTSQPAETPTPSSTPTATWTPTPTVTPTPALPKAEFVKDVTVPDGSVMKPGQGFAKSWRFKNVGAVGWGDGVKLAFVGGKQKGYDSNQMGGPDSLDVANVAPGKAVDVSVDLVAPGDSGHYRSYWRLRLGNGQWLENVHYADIYVASQETIAPGQEGIQFKVKVGGTWVTWTQPCGTPIPPGAVCICNCITVCTCDGVCSCDGHCTCDSVCGCVGNCTCDSVHYWHPN